VTVRRNRFAPTQAAGSLVVALCLCWPAAIHGHQASDPAALTDRGLELARGGETAAAAGLWQQALELAPDYFPALFNLAYMRFSSGNLEAAEPLLRRAVTALPTDFNAHYLLGVTNQKLGRGDEALKAWRRALEIRPDQFQLLDRTRTGTSEAAPTGPSARGIASRERRGV